MTIQVWKPITNADIDHGDHLQFYYDPCRHEFVYTYYEGTSLKYSEVITGTPWDWMDSPEADFLTAMVPEGDFLRVYRWKRRTNLSDEEVWFLDWARSAGASETSGCRFSIALSRKRIVGVDYIPGEVVQGEYCTGYLAVDWNPALEWMTTEPRAERDIANQ